MKTKTDLKTTQALQSEAKKSNKLMPTKDKDSMYKNNSGRLSPAAKASHHEYANGVHLGPDGSKNLSGNFHSEWQLSSHTPSGSNSEYENTSRGRKTEKQVHGEPIYSTPDDESTDKDDFLNRKYSLGQFNESSEADQMRLVNSRSMVDISPSRGQYDSNPRPANTQAKMKVKSKKPAWISRIENRRQSSSQHSSSTPSSGTDTSSGVKRPLSVSSSYSPYAGRKLPNPPSGQQPMQPPRGILRSSRSTPDMEAAQSPKESLAITVTLSRNNSTEKKEKAKNRMSLSGLDAVRATNLQDLTRSSRTLAHSSEKVVVTPNEDAVDPLGLRQFRQTMDFGDYQVLTDTPRGGINSVGLPLPRPRSRFNYE